MASEPVTIVVPAISTRRSRAPTIQLNGGRPFGAFQRATMGFNVRQHWTFEDRLDQGFVVDVGSNWTFRGFQSFVLTAGMDSPGYDPF